ncbi:hypothetical protein pb186bvf_015654 [Paramecium bursaria]
MFDNIIYLIAVNVSYNNFINNANLKQGVSYLCYLYHTIGYIPLYGLDNILQKFSIFLQQLVLYQWGVLFHNAIIYNMWRQLSDKQLQKQQMEQCLSQSNEIIMRLGSIDLNSCLYSQIQSQHHILELYYSFGTLHSNIKIKCVLLISTLLLSGTTLLLFIGAYQINQLKDGHLEIKINPQLSAVYIASAIINLFDIFVGMYIACNYGNTSAKNNQRKIIDKKGKRKEQREQISQLNTQQSNIHKQTDQTLDIYTIHGLEVGQYDVPQLKMQIKICIPPNQEVEI